MTTRRVLNIASRKKVDNMLPVVVAEDNVTTVGPYTSPSPLLCLFVPNARTTRTPVTNPAVRNSSDIFAVGYKSRSASIFWVEVPLCGAELFSC